MTKVDLFSGFLGAGKTTVIRKLLEEAYQGEKCVLIENEFGEIGIDGGFLKEAGVQITEMNSGCICCSLVGDFTEALKKVLEQFEPDRILIEPSGVGKLSDVRKAVESVHDDRLVLNGVVTVVDGLKVKMYMKNFGEFFNDQVQYAKTILVSRTQKMSSEKLDEVVHLLQEQNPHASLITTPWDELSGKQILDVMEHGNTLLKELLEEAVCPECGHVHGHGDHHHEHECCHGEHEHHEHECCHEEHGHHEHECCHGEHGHHEHERCHGEHEHHEHGHHHHHHADDIFESWGIETAHTYTRSELTQILDQLAEDEHILRAKGMVAGDEGWYFFDLVPGEVEIRAGVQEPIGKLCVIGTHIDKAAIKQLFRLA